MFRVVQVYDLQPAGSKAAAARLFRLNLMGRHADHMGMQNLVRSATVVLFPLAMLSSAIAAPPATGPEDRYIAVRDAAIAKSSKLNDAGKFDDAAQKAEDAVRADLKAQMIALLSESGRKGFAPPVLNLDTLSRGDEGFGMLDGLRFDADTGISGEKAGKGDGDKYVEPKAHIIVTSEHLFERWLRAHKDWWDKGAKNVPQQIGAALRSESFYTQAISTDAAVINFNALPITAPASATFAYGFLAGRTQDAVPDTADEVFVTAEVSGKVYVAYGAIVSGVKVEACNAIRADYSKRAEQADEKLRLKKIDKKAYDKLGDFRQQGEDAFKRCFTEQAPKQASFAEATKQAQALLEVAIGK